jgi:hypothetical protein
MKKNWINALPRVALLTGFGVLILFVLAVIFRPVPVIETNQHKTMIIKIIQDQLSDNKGDPNDKTFQKHFDKLIDGKVIHTVWLVDTSGRFVYAKGLMSAGTSINSNAFDRTDPQSRGLISAVEGNLDKYQKMMLYIAAAMRREGEHNDIYGHIVMPLKSVSSGITGYVGIAYELGEPRQASVRILIGISLAVFFLIYWLSLPLWVYYDSRERKSSGMLWTLFVFLGNLPALVAYLIWKKK